MLLNYYLSLTEVFYGNPTAKFSRFYYRGLGKNDFLYTKN